MKLRHLRVGERIRVMVVDDSVVIRRLVASALDQDSAIEVVGTASNGAIGLQRIPQLNPDVITLDIEMPDMDGLEMLRRVRKDHPSVRVIMLSTLTERGAAKTLEALQLGADDYLAKSSSENSGQSSNSEFRDELCLKVKQFFRFQEPSHLNIAIPQSAAELEYPKVPTKSVGLPASVVAIGTSTGGPTALGAILPNFPASFPLPVLIVQHMPPLFTRLLSERLNSVCALHVEEASQGAVVEPGKVLIAPGDFHMKLVSDHGRISVVLDQSAQENFCRPAVDVLFRSVAEVYGGSALAIVLTGMGQDGLRGAEKLREKGARIIAQDESSSVVWGMPGAVVKSGVADRVLPLDQVVPEVLRISKSA